MASHVPGRSFVVELFRSRARHSSSDAGFYTGAVLVGHPSQQFSVLFDTAAGYVVLPSDICTNSICLERHRYSPRASDSATVFTSAGLPLASGDLGKARDEISIGIANDLGAGHVVGGLVRDTVCLGEVGGSTVDGSVSSSEHFSPRACADMMVVAATDEASAPFGAMPADGLIGLGLDNLNADSAVFGLLRRLEASVEGLTPQFSLKLRQDRSHLTFGSSSSGSGGAVMWHPVVRPEDGYWQLQLHAVRVGNRTVDDCQRGCRAIIDATASHLGVPEPIYTGIMAALAVAKPGPSMSCQGPKLHLELKDGEELALGPEDYRGSACSSPRLTPIDLPPPGRFNGVYVLGESVLRRYDATFDWGNLRLGFQAVPAALPGLPAGWDIQMVDV